MRIPVSRQLAATLLASLFTACREETPTIRRDDLATERTAVAEASVNAPNPQLVCMDWIDPFRDASPLPFPHPVDPGNAMARVLDWAVRHHLGEQPSILLDNVSCPRARCEQSDDCWFRIKLDDNASTATSHGILWLQVHAQTGDMQWEGLLADGGVGFEPARASGLGLPRGLAVKSSP